jgi:hypothetical protein
MSQTPLDRLRHCNVTTLIKIVEVDDTPVEVINEIVRLYINIGEFRQIFHNREMINKIPNLEAIINHASNKNYINSDHIVLIMSE